MALETTENFSSASRAALPRVDADLIRPKQFAAGAVTLAVGTPVALSTATDNWGPWANAGANDLDLIKGFVWPEAIVLDAADEVLGNVMITGSIHRDDVVLLAGETQANLDSHLQDDCRTMGLHVQGLQGVR